MSDAAPTAFDRLRAIVKGGHLADMTGAEAKALLAYYVYADFTTGEAYPAMETIAAHCGVSNLHRARAAVQKLDARGALAIVRPSNGHKPTVRRLECLTPLTENRAGKRTGTENVPDDLRTHTGPVSDENRDGFGTRTGPETVPLTNKNTPRNEPKNKPKSKSRFSEGDCERVYSHYPRKEGKQDGLREIGKALERIAKRDNAPADPVVWLIGRVQAYAAKGLEPKYVKLPAGWFKASRFDDDTLDGGTDEFNIGFEEPSDAALATLGSAGDGSRVERTSDGFLAVRPSHETLNQVFQRYRTNPDGTFKETVDANSLIIDASAAE